jgi:hypothetical protein
MAWLAVGAVTTACLWVAEALGRVDVLQGTCTVGGRVHRGPVEELSLTSCEHRVCEQCLPAVFCNTAVNIRV